MVFAMSRFIIKQNDTSPAIRQELTSDGEVVDLSGASVSFIMEGKFDRTASIVDAAAGLVSYSWQAGDTATAGEFRSEWEVTFSDGKVETFPNAGYITIDIRPELDGTPIT